MRRVDTGQEALAELEVLVGFDDDLAGESTRLVNRIRGLLVTIHPALEKAIKPRLHHPAALELLITYAPGIGIRTSARILLEIGDIAAFATPGHLAAYAGLAPVTRRSGSSIKGEHPPKGGNKALSPPPQRRHLRHAPRQTALPSHMQTRSPSSLTNSMGTPPDAATLPNYRRLKSAPRVIEQSLCDSPAPATRPNHP